MKLYKTTILPTSNFATTLRGDTLFGQMCWSVKYAFGEDRLEELLADYESEPFLVVSDPFACGYLPKPTMPSSYLHENASLKKENRKKVWLTLQELQNGSFNKARADKKVENIDKNETIIRNAINYKTSTTSGDGFDPYGENEIKYTKKDIYFLLRDDFSVDDLTKALTMVAQMGYGKDSTIGKGRFEFSSFEKIKQNRISTTFMTLNPFTPNGLECKDIFYEPFVRFGKSGASRATTNAFKKPILLADSGTVVNFETKQDLNYIGKAIKNISTYKDIVHQGYAIVVGIKEL